MTAARLDLGLGHWLEFTQWSSDRELNPQYADLPDVPRFGAIVGHPPGPKTPNNGLMDGECMSGIYFELPEVRAVVGRAFPSNSAFWQVQSWEPLTLSPSLLCTRCGDHGFVREGTWVPA